MSKPSCRQLSVAPLAGVERQGRGSLGGGGLAVGISHSLPSSSHFIQGTHPFSGLLPQFHQGQGLGGGDLFSSGERSNRACSSPFSGLLQPSFCGDEGFRVVEAGDRPFVAEPEGSEDVLQDGDSPVGHVVCPTWRLDGVSRLERRLLASSDASGIAQVPQVRGVREGLPVQSSVLWSLHGSTSLHTGHGSGFSLSSSGGYSSSSLLGRLAHPGLLQGAGSSCSGVSSPALQPTGYRRQLGEVSSGSLSTGGVSGSSVRFCVFQGFACPKESVEASLNWRRVLVLRAAASLCLAGAVGSAGFIDPAHSRGETSDSVPPVLSQSVLGLFGSVFTNPVGCGLSSRSPVVAGSASSGVRSLPESDFSTARVVVRRLGCRLGRSSRRRTRFRPLVSQRAVAVHQCQGVAGNRESSVIFRSSSAGLRHRPVRRQFYSDCLPSQSGGYSVEDSEFHCSAESLGVILAPQFILGRHNVMADALSRPNQVLGSEWSLKIEVFQELRKRWPVSIDLFATSLNHRCSLYFSPFHDPSAVATDALLQDWSGWLAYAFPPWALIPAVLKKLRSSSGVLLTLVAPYWPQRPWFPELLDLVVDGPVTLPLSRDLLRQPHFHRFHLGVSRLSLHAWRLSSDLPSLRGSPGM